MFNLKDLTGLSEPATELIKRCANGVGGIFQPTQTKRMALAESEAAIIQAKAEIEVSKIRTQGEIEVYELQQRGIERLLHEEGVKQRNIENVVMKALPELKAGAKPQGIEEDWLTNFFDKCRLVSNEEMQLLWGKILAGEANSPGTYSKRCINLVQGLDENEAKAFQLVCRFASEIVRHRPLIYNINDDIYRKAGLNFEMIQLLQGIGLITFDGQAGFGIPLNKDKLEFVYSGRVLKIKLPDACKVIIGDVEKWRFYPGQIMLTNLGKELSSLLVPSPVEGFSDYLIQAWPEFGYEVLHQ